MFFLDLFHLFDCSFSFELGLSDGCINENFNFELFKNLCNQLEDIKISLGNTLYCPNISSIDEKTLFKLFDGYNFPYLVDFTIETLYINRLKKKFINRLPAKE